jgi:ribosomal protein S2
MYLNKLLILKKLQEANAHLGATGVGTKYSKWSRFGAHRAQSYIYAVRQRQTIIHLDYTIASLRRACNVIQLMIQSNGHLLFINTNSRYNKIIRQTADYTDQSYINHKWIGGFLTNWNNMQNVQQQFHEATKWSKPMKTDDSVFLRGLPDLLIKKNEHNQNDNIESLNFDKSSLSTKLGEGAEGVFIPPRNYSLGVSNNSIQRSLQNSPKYKKMQKCFEGVKQTLMNSSGPDCVIILNANQNSTAIYEAHLNQIPIIALVDSQIPDKLYNLITYPIPVNCESAYFIYLFCNCVVKTTLNSRKLVNFF